MTVNNIGVGNTQTPTDNRSSNANGNSSATSVDSITGQQSNAVGSDTVNISSQAGDLQALEARINELPDVDRTRVNEIRARIANDQYEINTEQLAEKIIGFEAGL